MYGLARAAVSPGSSHCGASVTCTAHVMVPGGEAAWDGAAAASAKQAASSSARQPVERTGAVIVFSFEDLPQADQKGPADGPFSSACTPHDGADLAHLALQLGPVPAA